MTVEVGSRFNRLTVLSLEYINKSYAKHWLCLCDCGNTKVIRADSLVTGNTQSCGCLLKERQKEANTKHGMAYTRIYTTWEGMNARCNSKGNEYHSDIGVTVCEDWKNSFEKFYEDMGASYSDELLLDRIDSNGNYNKDNCRWVTRQQNSQNRVKRKKGKYKYKGVFQRKSGNWGVRITNNGEVMMFGKFDTEEQAAKEYNKKAIELFGEFASLNDV